MIQGGYSMQYSALQRQDEVLFKDKEDLDLNMERSRRMQAETSKRRKALAIRRKQDAEREERRRQQILARRRENIKTATEKYQRLNKNYQPRSDAEIRQQLIANQSHHTSPGLEEALRAVRGSSHYRVPSPNLHIHAPHGTAVAAHPHGGAAHSHGGAAHSAGLHGHGPVKANHTVTDNQYLQGAHAYYQQPYQASYTAGARRAQSAVLTRTHERPSSPRDQLTHTNEKPPLPRDASRDVRTRPPSPRDQLTRTNEKPPLPRDAARDVRTQPPSPRDQLTRTTQKPPSPSRDNSKQVDLQSNSLRNVTNSRSLFEQQLENQQSQLMQEQRDLLDNFSSALHNELGNHSNGHRSNGIGHHNNSSCSVDSLEGGTNSASNSNTIYTNTHASRSNNTAQSNASTPHGAVTLSNAVTFTSHRPTNSPVAVVTPSIIRRSASDSSIPHQKTNAPLPRPYNKNNYDVKVDQTLLEQTNNTAPKIGTYLDTYGISTTDTHVGTYGQGTVVNTVGIEGHFSKYNTNGATAQNRQKAWVTPSSEDLREVGKTHTIQGSSLTTGSKPIVARPGFENSTLTNGHVPSGYSLHTSGANTTSGTNGHVTGGTQHARADNTYKLGLDDIGATSYTSHYTNGSTSKPSHIATTPNSHIATTPNSHTLTTPYRDVLTANTTYSQHTQPTTAYGETTTANSHTPTTSHRNGSIYSSHTNNSAYSTSTSGYNARDYSSTCEVPSTQSAISNAYANTPNSVPTTEQQLNTLTTSNTGYSVTPSRGYELTSQTNATSSSAASHNSHNQNATKVATPHIASRTVESSVYGAYGTTKATPVIGVNASSNAHVRITIPQRDPRRAIPTVAAGIRATADDASKIPRPKNPPISLRQANISDYGHQDVPTPDSTSDVEEESHPEPPHKSKGVKGILKKPGSATYPRRTDSFGVRGQSSAGLAMQRSMSAHAQLSIRDSLDLAKEQLSDRSAKKHKIVRKKSVRFWDMDYEEESAESEADEPPPDFVPLRSDDPSSVPNKPPRSQSAKVANTKPRRDPGHRVMSAGSARRGPFLRPHPPPNPPTGRAAMSSNSIPRSQSKPADVAHYVAIPTATAYTNTSHVGKGHNNISASEVDKSIDAVYDANGVRLDHTPTDEEINWLWDKVRTCLNRDDTSSDVNTKESTAYTEQPNQYNNPRNTRDTPNTQGINTKYIDGTSIAPQYRAQQRIGTSSGYGQTNAVPRSAGGVKKVSMDTLNNFNRRQTLLNQRKKEQGTINYHQPELSATVQMSLRDLTNQKPVPSVAVPSVAVPGAAAMTSTGPGIYPNNVTESLAAFMTAEQMVGQNSTSESQIEQAMLDAQSRQASVNASANVRNAAKVPSALSIEEQRLIQSLDRLNERLKANENGVSTRMAFEPQPPNPQYGGFKGRQPFPSNYTAKRLVTPSGTVPRQPYRVSSATATGYPGNTAYSQHRYK